jgi:hypothetical protein
MIGLAHHSHPPSFRTRRFSGASRKPFHDRAPRGAALCAAHRVYGPFPQNRCRVCLPIRIGMDRRINVEAWKYSDLRNRLKTAVPLAARPGAEASTAALKTAADAFFGITRHRLVLIDGFLDPGLSDGEALKGEGVEVASVAEALSVGDDGSADLLSVPEIAGNDVALALNTAFAADGVVVRVGEGARPSKPIEIVNIVSRERPHAVHARNRVVLGNGAEATFLESVAGGCEASRACRRVDGVSTPTASSRARSSSSRTRRRPTQDDEPGAAGVRGRLRWPPSPSSRSSPTTSVRPRRHLRPDRRDHAVLPDGARRAAGRGRAPADRGLPRRRHRRPRRRGDRRRAEARVSRRGSGGDGKRPAA